MTEAWWPSTRGEADGSAATCLGLGFFTCLAENILWAKFLCLLGLLGLQLGNGFCNCFIWFLGPGQNLGLTKKSRQNNYKRESCKNL